MPSQDRLSETEGEKMGAELRISGIIRESIVDGPGMRFVVFCQGCPHRCEGCHNPQTHDFEGGNMCATDKLIEEIKSKYKKKVIP